MNIRFIWTTFIIVMIYRKSYLTKKHTVLVNIQNTTIDVVTLKLGVGETISRYANGVTMEKWKHKRNVFYISSVSKLYDTNIEL